MNTTLTAAHIAETHDLLMRIYRQLREKPISTWTIDDIVDVRISCLNNAIRLKVHCLDNLPTISIKED
jgi:hypothetical protein